MVCNLTSYFLKAIDLSVSDESRDRDWSSLWSNVIPKVTRDWNSSSIETWASVNNVDIDPLCLQELSPWELLTQQRQVISYFRIDLPLVFLLRKYTEITQNLIFNPCFVLVYVDDFLGKDYSINIEEVQCRFISVRREIENQAKGVRRKKEFWTATSDIVNPQSFSISDLWWATIRFPDLSDAGYDLTGFFIDAMTKFTSWPQGLLLKLLAEIKRTIPESNLTWETGSENWAVLTFDDRACCFINVDFPLAFLQKNFPRHLQDLLQAYQLVTVLFDNEESNNYRLDSKKVSKVWPDWRYPNCSLDIFSIADLVYGTM
jgi:hypothetical protein